MTQASGAALDAGAQARADVLRGCALIVAAGCFLSLGIFAIRSAGGSDAWQYLFWRAIGLSLATMALAVWSRRQSPLALVGRMGRAGWLAAGFMSVSQITFISAIKLTTVTETFVLCALAPLMAAGIAWPLFGERITRVVAAAILLGFAGVVVMSGGAPSGGSWSGRALALVSAAVFAGYTLSVRRAGGDDLAGSLVAVGWMTFAACAIALQVSGLPWVFSAQEVLIAVAHGALILSVGLYLFGKGARYVSGVTLTLLAQTETVLAPVWGTLVFKEPLTAAMALGGAMVLAAVLLQTWASTRR